MTHAKTLILTPNKNEAIMERKRAEKRRWYQKYKERIKAKNNFYYHNIKKRVLCQCGKPTLKGRCSSCALSGRKVEWSKEARERRKGSNSPNWKGDNVKLSGLKSWVRKNKPKPNLCENCKRNVPSDLSKKSKQDKRDINNYRWLCHSCCMFQDGRLKNMWQNHKIGYKLSAETKQKIRLNQLEHWKNPQYKENIRQKRLHQIIPLKNTKIEIVLQQELTKRKISFITHKPIIGQPDIFIEPNICIFADGNYWHNLPKAQERDKRISKELEDKGYRVLRFWEKEINNNIDRCIKKKLREFYENFNSYSQQKVKLWDVSIG